jgi:aminoethylphosphonate catabolism LysR family transcriptional regulator
MYEKWLQAFHMVAKEGGFTAAAKVLNVGQPTVSTHVRSLENYFGVELFHRRGRSVALTGVGRSLLVITDGLFGHEEEAVKFLRAAQELQAGELNFSAIGPYDVMELLEAFGASYPKLRFSVVLGSTDEVLKSLLEFDSDIGILGHEERDPRFFCKFYNRHELLVMVNAAHPLADRRAIAIEELDGQEMVLRGAGSTTRKAFFSALDRAGVKIRPVMEIKDREAAREAVIRGLGIGVVSECEFASHERLKALRVSNARMHIYASVACLAERRNRPLIAAFFETVDRLAGKRNAKREARVN